MLLEKTGNSSITTEQAKTTLINEMRILCINDDRLKALNVTHFIKGQNTLEQIIEAQVFIHQLETANSLKAAETLPNKEQAKETTLIRDTAIKKLF